MPKNRASTSSVAALLLAGYAAALASATTFIVGDDEGWTISGDYIAWVKGKTFAVGDKLVFSYPTAEHTVTEVGKTDYFACAGGNALSDDRSGSTNVTLTVPGTRYFICNIPGHCTVGMRLAVTVAAGGGGTSPGATPTGSAVGATVPPATGFVVLAAAAGATIRLAMS
ncbi:hypothetical protein BS78_02G211200 [Paspalum vaginatum]|nr:hypothetical protein BS78_02G211200 [Paspalum vaginatum]KAJ1290036.1 hypothetical protein BS78_02G211200 [Paspalum vaginatum]